MNKLTLFLSLLIFSGCQKSAKTLQNNGKLPDSFYQHLRGTFGEDSVLFDLSVNNRQVTGYCQIPGNDDLTRFHTDSADRTGDTEWTLTEVRDNRNGENDSLANHLVIRRTDTGFEGVYQNRVKKSEQKVVLSEDYSDGALRFTSEAFSDSLLEDTARYFGSRADIAVQLLKPVGADSWLLKLLAEMRGDSSGVAFDSVIPRYRSSFFGEFRTTRNEMAAIGQRPVYYYSNSNQNVRFNHNGLLVIEHYESGYTGGAHGNYNTNVLCVDRGKKKKLELNDILDISEGDLQSLLESAAHDQLGLSPGAPLSDIFFENQLLPSANFGFNSNGLYFLYNPYEVAPYVVGQIWIYLPYNLLNSYLKPEFKNRIGIR